MRNIALIGFVLVLIPFCFLRPWIGALVWTWLGFMNPHRFAWGFARDLPLAQVVGIAMLAGLFFDKERKPIPWNGLLVVLLSLGAYFSITTFFAWAPGEAWAQWDKVLKIFLITFVLTMVIHGREKIRYLLLVVAISLGFFGVKGGIFGLATGGQYKVWGPAGSFIFGNTAIGLAMVMVLPLIYFVAREEPLRWVRYALYAAFGLTVIATIFTYSRGAWLGLATVLFLIFVKSRYKILMLLVAIPAAYMLAEFAPEKLFQRAETIESYEEDKSAMQRIQAWGVAFNIAKDRPLLGAGFNFEYGNDMDALWLSYANFLGEWENKARSAHSAWFQVLGQHGFVALGLFVLLLLMSLYKAGSIRKAVGMDPERSWMASYANAIQIGLIGYIVSGTFLSLAYFDLLYTYIAVVAILCREVAQEQAAEAKPAYDTGRSEAVEHGAE